MEVYGTEVPTPLLKIVKELAMVEDVVDYYDLLIKNYIDTDRAEEIPKAISDNLSKQVTRQGKLRDRLGINADKILKNIDTTPDTLMIQYD